MVALAGLDQRILWALRGHGPNAPHPWDKLSLDIRKSPMRYQGVPKRESRKVAGRREWVTEGRQGPEKINGRLQSLDYT